MAVIPVNNIRRQTLALLPNVRYINVLSRRRPAGKEITMTATASVPADLEPIETASVDELRSLQLERLRLSLRHAYDNVPHYRRAFESAAIHPDDCQSLAD